MTCPITPPEHAVVGRDKTLININKIDCYIFHIPLRQNHMSFTRLNNSSIFLKKSLLGPGGSPWTTNTISELTLKLCDSLANAAFDRLRIRFLVVLFLDTLEETTTAKREQEKLFF